MSFTESYKGWWLSRKEAAIEGMQAIPTVGFGKSFIRRMFLLLQEASPLLHGAIGHGYAEFVPAVGQACCGDHRRAFTA